MFTVLLKYLTEVKDNEGHAQAMSEMHPAGYLHLIPKTITYKSDFKSLAGKYDFLQVLCLLVYSVKVAVPSSSPSVRPSSSFVYPYRPSICPYRPSVVVVLLLCRPSRCPLSLSVSPVHVYSIYNCMNMNKNNLTQIKIHRHNM